jgi:hypothetical protein
MQQDLFRFQAEAEEDCEQIEAHVDTHSIPEAQLEAHRLQPPVFYNSNAPLDANTVPPRQSSPSFSSLEVPFDAFEDAFCNTEHLTSTSLTAQSSSEYETLATLLMFYHPTSMNMLRHWRQSTICQCNKYFKMLPGSKDGQVHQPSLSLVFIVAQFSSVLTTCGSHILSGYFLVKTVGRNR